MHEWVYLHYKDDQYGCNQCIDNNRLYEDQTQHQNSTNLSIRLRLTSHTFIGLANSGTHADSATQSGKPDGYCSAYSLTGIGNIPGAMLGGLLLGVIEALGAAYISFAWKDAIAFFVLILILIVRPTGLLGERVAEKV